MESVFLQILSMSLTASIVILVVLVLRLFLKRTPRYINCILWAFVAVRLIMPIAIESEFSLMPGDSIYEDIKVHSKNDTAQTEELIFFYEESSEEIASSEEVIQQTNLVNTSEEKSFSKIEIISCIWAVGVLAMLAYASISSLILKSKLKSAIIKDKKIFISDNIKTPFLFGLVKPRIYIPSSLPESITSYVIAHENIHLKRGDNIWKLIAFILLSVHWFNPIVWIAFVMFVRDIELACDERVISKMDTTTKKEYANALLLCSTHKKAVFSYSIYFGEIGIKSRIKAVKNYMKPTVGLVVISLLVCIIVAGCFLTNPKKADTDLSETEVLLLESTSEATTIESQESEVAVEVMNSTERRINIVGNTVEIDDVQFVTDECTITPWRYSFDDYCLIVYSFVDGDDSIPIYVDAPNHSEISHKTGTLNNRKIICDTIYLSEYASETEVEYRVGGYASDVCFYLPVDRTVSMNNRVEVDIDASDLFYTEGARIFAVELKEDRILIFTETRDGLHSAFFDVLFTITDVNGNEYAIDFDSCGYSSIVSESEGLNLLVHFDFVEPIPTDRSEIDKVVITSDINGASVTIDFNN